ncbi:MAG: hypothetical protein HN929_05020 [Chloroflexi bacterium]|jgi:hypothetical protein|nr:hypothetical protein [Chloroflexota bacterium]MBT7080814.1 hypothetical protein [Chloroflexota bacterium]MBT7289709.1 hypothetical protein [Chloroflexota bacterium]
MSEQKSKDQGKEKQFADWMEQMKSFCGPDAEKWMVNCAPNTGQACSCGCVPKPE